MVDALVQPTIKLIRERISRNPRQPLAHYLLGLCYLNYNFLDRGSAELQHALVLASNQHTIRFELAMVQLLQGKHASALNQIRQARVDDPTNPDYQYMEQYLAGRNAQARGDTAGAIRYWIVAYELAPRWSLAAQELRQFVAAHEAGLTNPALRLGGLNPPEAAKLRLLQSDPRSTELVLPPEPEKPRELGQTTMSMIRSIMPGTAEKLEQMHQEKLQRYEQQVSEREAQRVAAVEQLKTDIANWRDQVRQIRGNLGLMARLCLAVYEAEVREAREPDLQKKRSNVFRGRSA